MCGIWSGPIQGLEQVTPLPPSPSLKALGMAAKKTELSKEILYLNCITGVFLRWHIILPICLLTPLRHIMCTFGLQIKKENKISGLPGEWPWRGYLILLSLFLLGFSKSLHFSMAVRIKWSNAGIMLGPGRHFIHQMALYLNPLCHLLTWKAL